MHKYEILLTDEQEKRLTEIAVKGGKTKEEVLSQTYENAAKLFDIQ